MQQTGRQQGSDTGPYTRPCKKRQNGRRFKEDGEEAFTLTGQDRHGVAVNVEPMEK